MDETIHPVLRQAASPRDGRRGSEEVPAETLRWLDRLEHAKRPARRPTVLTVSEVRHLLAQLRGTKWLMANRHCRI